MTIFPFTPPSLTLLLLSNRYQGYIYKTFFDSTTNADCRQIGRKDVIVVFEEGEPLPLDEAEAAATKEAGGASLVGRRVSIFWPNDKKSYTVRLMMSQVIQCIIHYFLKWFMRRGTTCITHIPITHIQRTSYNALTNKTYLP